LKRRGGGPILLRMLNAQIAAPPVTSSYARIAVLRPHDGDTVDFEAGYVRHLEWHRQVKDTWTWYRMVAGGASPRYVRLRPRPNLTAILDGRSEQSLPEEVDKLVAKTTIEILSLRPAMSYNLTPATP
jgi:hypothetical protein